MAVRPLTTARTAPLVPRRLDGLHRPKPAPTDPVHLGEGATEEDGLYSHLSLRDALNLQIVAQTMGVDPSTVTEAFHKTPTPAPEIVELSPNATEYSTTQLTVDLSVELSITMEVEAEAQTTEAPRQDPLALDLNGDGRINLSTAAGGIRFDIDADGRPDQTAFVTGGDAFLALDRDGDGLITHGGELFGDVNGARDGFADLATLDDNADGVINARDALFEELRVFDGHHTYSLAEAGVTAIALDAVAQHVERADGNAETASATFTRQDGTIGRVADVLLAYRRG